jgi:hypothetical protein
MKTFWIRFSINQFTSTVLPLLRNPQDRREFKEIILLVFRSIQQAYPNDPDFNPQTSALNNSEAPTEN